MREYFWNLVLWLAEMILGRSACFIYSRPKWRYATYRTDGYIGNSPLLKEKPIKEYKYHIIIPNKYPYKKFSHHYLIVPKREINTLLELTPEEQWELICIMGEYEAQWYTLLSGQFGTNKGCSVAHKHVHVLK